MNLTYGTLYTYNKCTNPASLWQKVEKAKSALIYLKDNFQKIDKSIELLEKSKDAFKSELVAEAKNNLLEIQKTKKELFENIINAL